MQQKVSMQFADSTAVMARALELAARGAGLVEPNPMVGAVLVDSELRLLGEGFHQRYGGPHAEVEALRDFAIRFPGEPERLQAATLYVTLEPCCHHGKTPPSTAAVLAAGIPRVVVAVQDPFPQVAGGGLAQLQAAGVHVEVGLLADQAAELLAPFRTLVTAGRPFVHAKWAMSLDGKLAAHTGVSCWISGLESRAVVHQLRGRMDGLLVGLGTVLADDPSLTVRPAGLRVPVRIVLDRLGRLPLNSQLVTTAREVPVLDYVTEAATPSARDALQAQGVEVVVVPADSQGRPCLAGVLNDLGRRRFTNLLVEGGSGVFGSFFDQNLVDEVHVFLAPKIIGGAGALSPVGGLGLSAPPAVGQVGHWTAERLGADFYMRGRILRDPATLLTKHENDINAH